MRGSDERYTKETEAATELRDTEREFVSICQSMQELFYPGIDLDRTFEKTDEFMAQNLLGGPKTGRQLARVGISGINGGLVNVNVYTSMRSCRSKARVPDYIVDRW